MPEYPYRCTVCKHEFSIKKPIAEATREEVCPVCSGESRKVWAATAVHTSCQSGSTGFS